MSDLKDILRKVQAMLAKADDPAATPEEAEAFRTKAEQFMFKYRIDEMMLSAADKQAMGVNVQWSTVVVCASDSDFRWQYLTMLDMFVRHMEIRKTYWLSRNRNGGDIYSMDDNGDELYCELVGYESDLLFVEAMFTTAALEFGKRLEPKYDPSVSDQINAYNMRSAGMEGHRIAMAIYGKDDKALRPKVRKMFAAEATLRGEDPSALLGKGFNAKLYRDSYAQGFVSELASRLWSMQRARATVEHGLVLSGRKSEIDEAYYARFPGQRPKPVPAIGEADTNKCAKCAKAKSGACNDHRWMRPSRAKGRTRYANSTAVDRGRSAARSVDLGITGREVN